jgi:HEAT repeats
LSILKSIAKVDCFILAVLEGIMDSRFFLIMMLGVASVGPIQAGIINGGLFFGKKPAKNPAERVPELIGVLKSDGDEDKRADAASELRQFDPVAFPMIVPVLIEALINDKKPSVRAEAAISLSKIRPVSPLVGQALENAVSKDASMRVRIQARSSLLQYNLAGYRSAPKNIESAVQSGEPPLADAPVVIPPLPVSNGTPVPAKPTSRINLMVPGTSPSLRPVPSSKSPEPLKLEPIKKDSKVKVIDGPELLPN